MNSHFLEGGKELMRSWAQSSEHSAWPQQAHNKHQLLLLFLLVCLLVCLLKPDLLLSLDGRSYGDIIWVFLSESSKNVIRSNKVVMSFLPQLFFVVKVNQKETFNVTNKNNNQHGKCNLQSVSVGEALYQKLSHSVPFNPLDNTVLSVGSLLLFHR